MEPVVRTDSDFITYDYTPITKIDDKTIVKTVVEPDDDDWISGDIVQW
jgi:hypothetical protein